MGDTGLAAVVRAYNAPMEIVEYPVPDPEPGALTVAVDVTSVCGTDVHNWQGQYDGVLPVELPLILGHEVVGRITAIGDGADVDSLGRPLTVGDRVVWTHEPCGRCWACAIDNEPTLCPTRRVGMFETSAKFPHFSGTFAQYSYVWPKAGRLRVPDDVDSRWASAASCALRTVVNAVERAGWVDYMDHVVVQGAGPVGLFATALLAAHSPRTLVTVGAPDDRLDVARSYGATHTISIEEHPDPAERLAILKDITGGRGASVAVEASGAPNVVAEGIEMIAPNGRYVLVGSVGAPAQPILAHRIINRGLTLVGSFGGNIDSYHKALEFMRHNASRFDWNRVIGKDYRLDQVDEAIADMQAFRDIKPVITPFATS